MSHLFVKVTLFAIMFRMCSVILFQKNQSFAVSKQITEISRKALLCYFFFILGQTELQKIIFSLICKFSTAC